MKRSALTEEHIFPKSLTLPGTKQIRELIPRIDVDKRYRKNTQLAQNGLKLRTTCAKCNNYLLGTKYDPALKHLHEEASLYVRNIKFLSGNLIRLEDIELKKVVRAVIGHMLAADKKPNPRAPKSRAMRRVFFDCNYKIPGQFSILMWLYPSKEQAIIRDIFVTEEFGRKSEEMIWISAYKTFPLAFAFAHRSVTREWPYRGVLDITSCLSSKIDSKFTLTLSLKDIPHQIWPETPTQSGAIFMGDGQRLLTRPHTTQKSYNH